MSVAEDIAEYILSRVRHRAPRTWRQAARSPAALCAPQRTNLREFADRRILGVSELAVRGLFHIEEGFPVRVWDAPFSPEAVLALQARGLRCVSLLPTGACVPEPHSDALAYVLHDLCHVAKFADPRYYDEQVGFFWSVERAFVRETWWDVERQLDAQWRADRVHVSADMNGSSVFLFVCLKARLKLAASRAAARGAPCSFPDLFEGLLDTLDFVGPVRDAARRISSKSGDPAAAEVLADQFRHRAGNSLGVGIAPGRFAPRFPARPA